MAAWAFRFPSEHSLPCPNSGYFILNTKSPQSGTVNIQPHPPANRSTMVEPLHQAQTSSKGQTPSPLKGSSSGKRAKEGVWAKTCCECVWILITGREVHFPCQEALRIGDGTLTPAGGPQGLNRAPNWTSYVQETSFPWNTGKLGLYQFGSRHTVLPKTPSSHAM
jgi:hypothetical protein